MKREKKKKLTNVGENYHVLLCQEEQTGHQHVRCCEEMFIFVKVKNFKTTFRGFRIRPTVDSCRIKLRRKKQVRIISQTGEVKICTQSEERATNKIQLIRCLLSNFYLNMFRSSLCPSSGDQDGLLLHMVFCSVTRRGKTIRRESRSVYGSHVLRFPPSCSPDDGHNDARNMLRQKFDNKHLISCILLVALSSLYVHDARSQQPKICTQRLKKSNKMQQYPDNLAVNKYLHTVASCWISSTQNCEARNHK